MGRLSAVLVSTIHHRDMHHHWDMHQPPRYPCQTLLDGAVDCKMNRIMSSKIHEHPEDAEISLTYGRNVLEISNGDLQKDHQVGLSRKGHSSDKQLVLSIGQVLGIYIN